MKIANILIILIVVLLSIAAGLAKVMQTEHEMEFLQSFGLNGVLIIAFGMVQVSGGVLLGHSKTRMFGAVLALSAFVASTILIFVGGNLAFGLLSIIPIALTCVIVYQSARVTRNKSLNTDTGDAGAG